MKNEENTKRAVIYARYSPGPNQTENSIEGQLKVCTEYAEQNNITIIDEYIDRAKSGKSDRNRNDFLRMIQDSEKGLFDAVLVYQLDRFARNVYDNVVYKAALEANGVTIISAKENIDDTPSGALLECVLMGLNSYYIKELSTKIKRGYSTKSAQCLYLGGTIPLGYYVDDTKHFQINTATAPFVETIFQMYANGTTIREINEYLNQQNIKSTRGNSFTKNSLSKLFSNRKYIGTYTFKDTEIPNGIPRLITDELFERVQQRMGEKKKASSKGKAKEEYILTPKLFCGHCKALMTGESGTSRWGKLHTYYKCNSAKKKKCDKKTVKKSTIENLVVEEARKQLTDENLAIIIKEVEKIYISEQDNSNLSRLKKELKECEKATENLLVALETGQATDIITDRLVKKQNEAKELKKLIATEELIYNDFSLEKVKFFLYNLKNGNNDDTKYRKALINIFINRVYLFDDKMTLIFNTDKNPIEIDVNLADELGICEGSADVNPSPFGAFST